MSIRNLRHLFRPRSVAVIGASNQPTSIGAVLMRNLLGAGFEGPIMPVHPKYDAVAGVMTYRDVAGLPKTPDLALIATPPEIVPDLIRELGEKGTKAAVVLTAGMREAPEGGGSSLQQQMIDAAKPHLMRILGPNCVGLIIPGLGLNASFAHTTTLPGKLALVTQSGALVTAILDWAKSKSIGFSHFISLGNSADVDFGDTLDYLGSDPNTRAILLYVESIRHARKFMSAARSAARNKPVVVVKAGRSEAGAKATASHTGALAGSDDVYDAAIRRAGLLRVSEIEDLFDAVETLARSRPFEHDCLTILTNGGGPGVMATDTLARTGGQLAELSPGTIERLDALLPPTWSRGNPVDIIGDAPVERYVEAMKILLNEPTCESILFIHAPSAVVPSEKIAEALVPVIRETKRNILTCWLGVDGVARARKLFSDNNIPTYDTPEDGVRAFMQIVDYKRNQEILMETPISSPLEDAPETDKAKRIVEGVLEQGRDLLTEPEAKAVLTAYGIPVVSTEIAIDTDEAVQAAEKLGFPIAVKILSPDISHKSDVGGVALDLTNPEEVRAAVMGMSKRIKQLKSEARIQGFAVQQMVRRPDSHELIVGAATDLVFGPVILFGQGGTAVEVIGDRAVALPPLNMNLARELVSRTRVSKLLAGYRNRPSVRHDDIYRVLIKISQLIADIPEIAELDINPLLADESGVIAVDARIRAARTAEKGPKRFAIRPYPRELEEYTDFNGRRIQLRPIRPEDEPAHHELVAKLRPEDRRLRFFSRVRDLTHSEMARLTQIDYDREMAFIATALAENGQPETLGVVRIIADPDNTHAEFALTVRSDIQRRGLGRILAEKMIRYCRDRGIKELVGNVIAENERMLSLAQKLGFKRVRGTIGETYELRLVL
ncbi:MAG: bifunctional acetate--CoA ligase family protein/GNAT family N-acetyltransferase [Myxococcota bacterium]|nr:bifunctional acetate--CoA ligase family protein/GNAT family N-acetyltransferase [Myxococcota bacterium]